MLELKIKIFQKKQVNCERWASVNSRISCCKLFSLGFGVTPWSPFDTIHGRILPLCYKDRIHSKSLVVANRNECILNAVVIQWRCYVCSINVVLTKIWGITSLHGSSTIGRWIMNFDTRDNFIEVRNAWVVELFPLVWPREWVHHDIWKV